MGAEVIRHQLLPQNVGISGDLANYQSDTLNGIIAAVSRAFKSC